MQKKAGLLEMIVMFFPLLGFWLVLSPKVTMESIAIGFVVCWTILIYSRDILLRKEEMPLYSMKKLVIFFTYIPVLIIEIFKSGIYVAKIVLSPSLPVKPHFVKKKLSFKNDFIKVLYGNSITLTPGTLTVDIKENEFIIHALTDGVAEGLEDSPMEQYAKKMEE
ncbi:Na+/H+ antiporter subunit E [Proteinivorax hydrogeniformans]|uniref:Na+/H+ antiporter subunit E n=2 Tax=Proteinivorax TaxID=1491776 RepID=A0AAU7VKU0_9FIRM